MTSPFPGMDPYLEMHWLDVHSTFITCSKFALNRVLPPDLVARSEERLAIDSAEWTDSHGLRPDVRVFQPGTAGEESGGIALEAPFKLVLDLEPITEQFIRIISPDNERVVTVIELVSPWNKREPGLSEYQEKRTELLEAGVSVVEIDLVRRGNWRALLRPHSCPKEAVATYRVITRLGGARRGAYVYPLHLDRPLTPVPIPLRSGDPLVKLDLQEIINEVYAQSRYGTTLNYGAECDPPLADEEREWANAVLHAAGKR